MFVRSKTILILILQIIIFETAIIAQEDELLKTTRWNIASYLYVLNYGRYDKEKSESDIDYAARLGFNAVRFNVWWHEIYPDKKAIATGGNWSGLDNNIKFAVSKGLKVIITVTLRAPPDTLFGREDCVMDSDGQIDINWDKTTRISFASPKFAQAIWFFRQVATRYKDYQNQGHILAIALLVTREAEIPYAHDKMEDYNPMFVREFRNWLENKHKNIENLNSSWATSYKSFEDINPPRNFSKNSGRDWYVFRDLKVRQFIDSSASALASIPGLRRPYRLLLDYGNVGDPMCWRRGSVSFVFHSENPAVWAVKQNDAHDYNQPYTGSLLGSVMKQINKLAFNEYFYDKDKARYPNQNVIEDSIREITAHYEQGMNGVSYVGVHKPNPDLETIIARLKQVGVWSAKVTPRKVDGVPIVSVKLSTLLGLSGWDIKEKYFDPHFRTGHKQVDFRIQNDINELLLPIIDPIEMKPE